MALFGSKKNTEKKSAPKPKVKKAAAVATPAVMSEKAVSSHFHSYAHVLARPRVTEKASILVSTNNAYTFEISKKASKHDVARAVFETYKVTPEKVTIVNLPRKHKIIRGKPGVKAGVKKAMVYLKKGDSIQFV